jgi:hypothetical protein
VGVRGANLMRWIVAVFAIGCHGEPRAATVPTVAVAEAPHVVLPAIAAPMPAIGPAPQRIDVDFHPATDTWDVRWTFATPTAAIVFDRAAALVRSESWRPATGLTWSVDDEGDEVLVAEDPARAEFAVQFDTDDRSASRIPAQNLAWTDGARLLFTGALGAYAAQCDDHGCTRRDPQQQRQWRLRTDGGRLVRVLTTAARGELVWDEPIGDRRGTYALFGDHVVTDGGGASLVFDGGMPTWLVTATHTRLPIILGEFADSTGLPLGFTPLYVVSKSGAGRSGWSVRGRTLPGMIQVEAIGRGWRRRTAAAERLWFELLIHESFHLWNSQVARRADTRDEWWSEGASSFVAGAVLRRAGLLDSKHYAWRLVSAGNRCAASLRGPLYDDDADRSFYACGELVQFALDRALRQSGGVMPIYRQLFAAAHDSTYGTEDFLRLCAAAGVEPGLLVRIRALLDHGLGPAPLATVAALLAGAGLETRVVAARGHRPARLRFVRRPARTH